MSTDGSHPRERGAENLITHRSVAFARGISAVYTRVRASISNIAIF